MIKVQYKPEYLAWIVIRVRGAMPHEEYLTNEGWKIREPNTQATFDETMMWDDEDLSELVTAVTAQGIKPKEASYIEGELKATKAHLEDMRTLVLKKK